jgi:Zn-dependent protease
MDTIFIFVFQLAILLFSVIIHEVSHGLTALRLGDETARHAGRLTLNPIKHLDAVGSFLVPLLLIMTGSSVILGWAKPVPYNPSFLHKDYKYGPLKVALAGPASNIAVAVFFAIFIRFGAGILSGEVVALMGFVVFLNILLAVFNLVPIPPLDGSKILTTFLPQEYAIRMEQMGLWGMVIILLFLFLFFPVISSITFSIFNILVGPEGAGAFLSFF